MRGDFGSSFSATDQSLRPANAPLSRSGRSPDYRLRGLDLAEPSTDESSRPIPKNRLRRRARRRLAVKWAVVVMVATVAALLARASVAQPFSVPSAAMVPTLQVGDRVLVVKWSLLVAPVKRGDIIVFRRPQPYPCPAGGEGQDLVKRVIALPGQTIWSVGNKIFIDGAQLRERGWYDPEFGQVGPARVPRTKIPPGYYFVLGDNRAHSCDSRSFGAIPQSLVVGKVVAVILRGDRPYFHFF